MLFAILPIAALAVTALAGPLPDRVEKRASDCSKPLILYARGTGETDPVSLLPLVQQLQATLTANAASVTYPASVIATGGSSTDNQDSVNQGMANTKAQIVQFTNDCKNNNPQLILLGFSQGGQVITDTLVGGYGQSEPKLDTSLRPYIKAVAVFGDPTHDSGKPYSAGNATTNGLYQRGPFDPTLADLVANFPNKLRSYCNAGDLICSGYGDNSNGAAGAVRLHAYEVYTYQGAAKQFILSLFGK